MPLTRGSLYHYNYLWSREHKKSEISGRKARPVCLVVRSSASPAVLFLFPLTTRPPTLDTSGLEIPVAERRRANLADPCWIILDEYNRLAEDELYDFESLRPMGAFSPEFLRRIIVAIAKVSETKRLKAVPRS